MTEIESMIKSFEPLSRHEVKSIFKMRLNSVQKAIKDLKEEIELLEPEASDILHPAYYIDIAFKKGLEELDKLEQGYKEIINA
jgi:hypothetical protein